MPNTTLGCCSHSHQPPHPGFWEARISFFLHPQALRKNATLRHPDTQAGRVTHSPHLLALRQASHQPPMTPKGHREGQAAGPNLIKLPPKPGPKAAAADSEPVHRTVPSGRSPRRSRSQSIRSCRLCHLRALPEPER